MRLSPMLRMVFAVVFLTSSFGGDAGRAYAADAPDRAEALTAAYVYYFTKFVSWQGGSLHRVCTVGAQPSLIAEFEKVVAKSKGSLTLRGISAQDDLADLTADECHVLYVYQSIERDWFSVAKKIPLLVVDENIDAEFSVIRLVMDGRRLSFEINRANAQVKELSVSAKLMKLAKRIIE